MANDYYSPTEETRLTLARAGNQNTERAAVEAAFDKLPAPDRFKERNYYYVVGGGSATVMTGTMGTPAPTAYAAGMRVDLVPVASNTGAFTVNFNGLGAKQVLDITGATPEAAMVVADRVAPMIYDGTAFRLLAENGTSTPATGSIVNAMVATGAAIDAAKIADASVSNAEFQYLNGVTSAIQTQIDGKIANVVDDTSPQLGGNLDPNTFGVTGNWNPSASDGAALGTTALMWSDAFFASGAVINWNNGDVTITHSANALAFAGASSGYSFDAALLPATSDAAALGSATLMWSDAFFASGGVINFNNGDMTITHSPSNYVAFAGGLWEFFRDAAATSHPVQAYNSFDAASVKVAVFAGDRATPASGDEAYITFELSDAGGVQTEFARLAWEAADATNASEDGALIASVIIAGSLTEKVRLEGSVFSPAASDGTALGSTSLPWSDLFLASGAVINFDGGDLTITHGSNALTFEGGQYVFSRSGGSTNAPLSTENLTDSASVIAARFEGDRATPANNDEAYIDCRLSDSAGNQDVFTRLIWKALDVTSTSEDGEFQIEVRSAGALTSVAAFNATATDIKTGFKLTNVITPAQITADQNDYAPTGYETCSIMRVSAGAPGWSLTGLAGGVDGRVVFLQNVGSEIIYLQDEDVLSTAANRFQTRSTGYETIDYDGVAILMYDGTVSRWRVMNYGVRLAFSSDMESANTTRAYVSPFYLGRHPAAAKCWVVGTPNSTTIIASYNITSLADTATGQQTVTIADNFSSANYCVNVTIDDSSTTLAKSATVTGRAAGSFVMNSVVEAGSGSDPSTAWHAVAFGDQ